MIHTHTHTYTYPNIIYTRVLGNFQHFIIDITLKQRSFWDEKGKAVPCVYEIYLEKDKVIPRSPGGTVVIYRPTQKTQEIQTGSLGRENPFSRMATHFSILTWKIPWMEEPSGLHPMVLQRVGYDWVTEQSHSVQLLSHVQLFATPWTASTPHFPVQHQLLKLAQTHVHWVSEQAQNVLITSNSSATALNVCAPPTPNPAPNSCVEILNIKVMILRHGILGGD